MNFVMARDRVVVSLVGRAVEFKKGVPTHVPPEMWKEVMEAGAVPEEEIPEPVAKPSNEPTTPHERHAALMEVFATMAADNKREEFTAAGTPHLKALASRLGWTVDARERDASWNDYLKRED